MASSLEESKTRGGATEGEAPRAPQQGLKCPRCDSGNTKFCYYNNYSLAQPRYFCKTCRRYWTKGGALRNVPVGGGCRKSAAKSSICKSSSSFPPREHKFVLRGLSSIPDFNLPASSSPGIFSLTAAADDHLLFDPSAGAMAAPHFTGRDLMLGSGGDLVGSMESLSCMNQGLHWKLQQQRLGSLFGGKQMVGNAHDLLESPSSGEKDLMAGGSAGWFAAEEHRGDGVGWNGNSTWSGVQQHHHYPFSALP